MSSINYKLNQMVMVMNRAERLAEWKRDIQSLTERPAYVRSIPTLEAEIAECEERLTELSKYYNDILRGRHV